jgi:hypothetical protein
MLRARIQFTIRKALLGIAVLAVVFWLIPEIVDLLSGEGPYNVVQRRSKRWQCGAAPNITVDVLEGFIEVLPGSHGSVSAEFSLVTVTKRSQWAADKASERLILSTSQHGDSIAIATDGASTPQGWLHSYITNQTTVILHVPDGVHLNLRVRKGRIAVGETVSGGRRVRQAVRAASIKAINESKLVDRNPFGLGNIVVNTIAPLAHTDGTSAGTKLLLEASGEIEMRTENALVDASAGYPTTATDELVDAPGIYRDGRERTINFNGSLAAGAQSFRAGGDVAINLAASPALRIRVEAANEISGDLVSGETQRRGDRKLWQGSFGNGPKGDLVIHSSGGSVSLATARPDIPSSTAQSPTQRSSTGSAPVAAQPR